MRKSRTLPRKPFSQFLMEDTLENHRFEATFNLGESGGWPRKIKDLLAHLPFDQAMDTFLNTKLCDSPNWGRADLRASVASFHAGATIDNVLITTGTSEALFLLFRHLQPRKLALPIPAFQLLYEIPKSMGTQVIPLPIRWDINGQPFCQEEEWLDILHKEKPDCLLINNPHNPSGLVFSNQLKNKVVDFALTHDCALIADEHYRFLSSEERLLGDTFYRPFPKFYATGSFIKCLGSPGLRIGWCVGPHKDLAQLQNEKNYTTHTVNPVTEWIAQEVLKNLDSPLWLNMHDEWKENKKILSQCLSSSKTIYGTIPQGGLVTSIGLKNVSSLSETKAKINELYQKNGLFVLPLQDMEVGAFDFQKQEKGINLGFGFRLGLGLKPKKFQEACNILL